MTDTELGLEAQAQEIAAHGRTVLVERMRTAYSDAVAANADLISLDDARIEAMVQSAVDRADGLQWRRALAAVAADALGVSTTEALSHPAVVRAQALVGAPSYEQSLAELIARPVPLPTPVTENGSEQGLVAPLASEAEPQQQPEPAQYEPPVSRPESVVSPPEPVQYEPVVSQPEPVVSQPEPVVSQPEPTVSQVDHPTFVHGEAEFEDEEPSEELESVEADDVVLELLPTPEPIEYETQAYDVEASFVEDPLPPAPVNPFAARSAEAEPAATFAEPEPVYEPQPVHEAQPVYEAEPEPVYAPEPVQETPDPVAYGQDEYLPETQQHQSAGVAAAIAAVTHDPPHVPPRPAQPSPEPAPEEPVSDDPEIVVAAIHLGGVANLPTKREGLSVRLSADGLDIMQGPRDIIGRLVWEEIEALEVPNVRARRRSKGLRARLVVRTPHGDASFEVPDIEGEELRDRVEPLMRLYGRH